MRTLDDILGLTPLPPNILLTTPPPSAQLHHPVFPPMSYHPAMTALSSPVVLPPPPPGPPPITMVPVRQPPPPPPQPPIITPSTIIQMQPPALPAQPPAVFSIPRVSLPVPAVADPIGGTIDYTTIPTRGPGGTRELRFASQLAELSGAKIAETLNRIYMSPATNIGRLVGGTIGGTIGATFGGTGGSLIGGFIGEKIGGWVVNNPLTRAFFAPFNAFSGTIIGGGAQIMLGAQGNIALAVPGSPATGLSFGQSFQISQQLMHQAQQWRWATGAGAREAEQYFRELSGLFTSAARSGIFSTAATIDQVLDQFHKVLRFSGGLARIMGDPDIKRNIEFLGQLTSMGMTLDQAMASVSRLARYARPLGISVKELFTTGGAMGAQIWAEAGLAPTVGIAQGAFAQMLASRAFASLSPMTAQLIGGQQQLAQILTQFSARFASGLPGQLLTMASLNVQGGALTVNPMQTTLAQGGTVAQTAVQATASMARAAQELVRSGAAANLGEAYTRIMMQQSALVSQTFESPERTAIMALRTLRQLRRQNISLSQGLALLTQDRNVAEALYQIINDPNFAQRLANIEDEQRRRAIDESYSEARRLETQHTRRIERRVGYIGLIPMLDRAYQYLAEGYQARSEYYARRELMARGLVIPEVEVTRSTRSALESLGYFSRANADIYERARRIIQQRPEFAEHLFGYESGVIRGLGLSGRDLYAAFLSEKETPLWITYVFSGAKSDAAKKAAQLSSYMIDLGDYLRRGPQILEAAKLKYKDLDTLTGQLLVRFNVGKTKDLSPSALFEFAAQRLGYDLNTAKADPNKQQEIVNLSVALLQNIEGNLGQTIRSKMQEKSATFLTGLDSLTKENVGEVIKRANSQIEATLSLAGIGAFKVDEFTTAVTETFKLLESPEKLQTLWSTALGAYKEATGTREERLKKVQENISLQARLLLELTPTPETATLETIRTRLEEARRAEIGIGRRTLSLGVTTQGLNIMQRTMRMALGVQEVGAYFFGGKTAEQKPLGEIGQLIQELRQVTAPATLSTAGKNPSELMYTAVRKFEAAVDKLLASSS